MDSVNSGFKKWLLAVVILGSFGVYALLVRQRQFVSVPQSTTQSTDQVATAPTSSPTALPIQHQPVSEDQAAPSHPSPTPRATPSMPMMTPTAMPMNSGQYKNGSYTGPVADAFYGNVQVKVVVSGGKISDVQFLQHPGDRQTSVEINSQAMPMLKQEAIQAQSAQVDGVSGATETSLAFISSLTGALQQAQ